MNNIRDLLIYKLLRQCKNTAVSVYSSAVSGMRYMGTVVEDHYGDRRLGIRISDSWISAADTSANRDAHIYGPAHYGTLREVAGRIGLGRDDVFVDLGCGQGRAVFFMAAQGIQKAVGVELNPALAARARENLARCTVPKSSIEIVEQDAAAYDIGNATVIFMFSPFGSKGASRVIENIKRSLDARPRDLRIAYVGCPYRGLFDAEAWLTPEYTSADGNIIIWKARRR